MSHWTPGWSPFDPSRDWTQPDLESGSEVTLEQCVDGRRWPKNVEALCWWRPTYWNGDPDALTAKPRETRS
jgi:hypothetical protein